MINFLKHRKWIFAGIAGGMAAGWAYYFFVGCSTGACPISSNPLISMVYWGAAGGLMLSGFRVNNKNKNHDNN